MLDIRSLVPSVREICWDTKRVFTGRQNRSRCADASYGGAHVGDNNSESPGGGKFTCKQCTLYVLSSCLVQHQLCRDSRKGTCVAQRSECDRCCNIVCQGTAWSDTVRRDFSRVESNTVRAAVLAKALDVLWVRWLQRLGSILTTVRGRASRNFESGWPKYRWPCWKHWGSRQLLKRGWKKLRWAVKTTVSDVVTENEEWELKRMSLWDGWIRWNCRWRRRRRISRMKELIRTWMRCRLSCSMEVGSKETTYRDKWIGMCSRSVSRTLHIYTFLYIRSLGILVW